MDTTREQLFQTYGPLIAGKDLVKVAGFRNAAALRSASRRGDLGFRTFAVPGRRGLFARTEDVVAWVSSLGTQEVAMK